MTNVPNTRVPPASGALERGRKQRRQRINVASAERAVSVGAGIILAGLGLARRNIQGALIAGVGAGLLQRGITGHSYAYAALGLDTARAERERLPAEEALDIAARGIHVEQALLIDRSPEELYSFWRNFENLPRIMSHLESVQVMPGDRSHWVARVRRLPVGRLEWDAEITRDEPNSLIAWRSLAGSEVRNIGKVRFSRAPADRGTEVHVTMEYLPPAGRLGHWIATLLGQSPGRQLREDLRNFKRVMEAGELPAITGQPHGKEQHSE